METILGIRGPNFVMVAADTTSAHSVVVMQEDVNKIHNISDKLVLAAIGEAGDVVQFTQFISKNIALYRMRNGYDLSPASAAVFTRRNLAEYLRSRTPYNVNMFIAGYDKTEGPELHYIDYLANAKSVKYAGQGYGGLFSGSIFDRYYHPNITEQEAYVVLQKCVAEIQQRLVINLPNFNVTVVNKNGTKPMPQIRSKSLAG